MKCSSEFHGQVVPSQICRSTTATPSADHDPNKQNVARCHTIEGSTSLPGGATPSIDPATKRITGDRTAGVAPISHSASATLLAVRLSKQPNRLLTKPPATRSHASSTVRSVLSWPNPTSLSDAGEKISPYDDIHALHAIVAVAAEIPLLDGWLHIAIGIDRADLGDVRARCGIPCERP